MKINVEHSGMKVSIEAEEVDFTLDELLEYFKSAALALTYQEESWKDAILAMAEQYREEYLEDGYTDYNTPEELSKSINLGGEDC